jgi:hypothetical protein
MTGVFHADPDCPAIRDTMEPTSFTKIIYELDRRSGLAWKWVQGWGLKDSSAGWVKVAEYPNHPDYKWDDPMIRVSSGSWRPCLRCGSLRRDGTYRARATPRVAPPCPVCNLTPCCCD